jgi:hypothetical protein
MNATRIEATPGFDHQITINSTVVKTIRDIRDGRRKSLQEALSLIRHTFYVANSKRREPRGKVLLFSVNVGDKGRFKLMRLKAITTLNTERKIIIALNGFEEESAGSNLDKHIQPQDRYQFSDS